LWEKAKIAAAKLQEREVIVTYTGHWEDFVTCDFLTQYTDELLLY